MSFDKNHVIGTVLGIIISLLAAKVGLESDAIKQAVCSSPSPKIEIH